jgi:hypothetical protein
VLSGFKCIIVFDRTMSDDDDDDHGDHDDHDDEMNVDLYTVYIKM